MTPFRRVVVVPENPDRKSPMVTTEHEAQIELNQRFPSMVLEELAAAGIMMPADAEVEMESERCTQTRPVELTADGIATVTVNGHIVMAVIHEVQRQAVDEKRRSWVQYGTRVWARYECPVVLLVYCPDPALAAWASKPIDMGPLGTITPRAISPKSFPVITDLREWDGPIEQAVLGALGHANGPDGPEVIAALSDLLATIDEEQAEKYAGCLLEILPEPMRTLWEDMMTAETYSYQGAFALIEKHAMAKGEARGEARGQARGNATALLNVLKARGIAVSESVRERILACTDSTVLDGWIARSVSVATVDELFE